MFMVKTANLFYFVSIFQQWYWFCYFKFHFSMFVSNQSSCRTQSGHSVGMLHKTSVGSKFICKSASPIPVTKISRWQSQIPLVMNFMWLKRLNSRLQMAKRIPSCSRSISASHRWVFLILSICSQIRPPSVRTKFLCKLIFDFNKLHDSCIIISSGCHPF